MAVGYYQEGHGAIREENNVVKATENSAKDGLLDALLILCCTRKSMQCLRSGVAQWLERRSWPANFPRPVLDLQLWVSHPLQVNQPGQLSLSSLRGR